MGAVQIDEKGWNEMPEWVGCACFSFPLATQQEMRWVRMKVGSGAIRFTK
jgi:hypothetical protein